MSLMTMHQTCTYWAQGAWDADGGSYASVAPVLLGCRWQDQQKLIRDSGGLEVMSSAVVYTPQAVAMAGKLMPGDQTAQATPPAGARSVLSVGQATTMAGTVDHWKVWLQ